MRRGLAWLFPLLLSTSCTVGLVCTDLAAVSLSLTVKDASGRVVPGATATWRADGDRSGECTSIGDDLLCGYEVAGAMTVDVQAPGFQPSVVAAAIDSDECHVIGQQRDVVLERKSRFDEERRYVHAFFADQAACTAAQPEGFFVNCCAFAVFKADGSAEMMVTDIMNGGTYVLGDGIIDFTRESPGDVADQVRFVMGAGDTLIDDDAQWSWKRAAEGCW